MFTKESIKQFLKPDWRKIMNAWNVAFLGIIILVLLGKFNSQSSDSGLVNNMISVLAFSTIFICFFGYVIFATKNFFFRPSQMKRIAQKYNLNYTKPKETFLFISPSSTRKCNIIEGKINSKNILIYDFVDYRPYWLILNLSGILSERSTIISVDGRKTELNGFFTGFGSVKKIDKFLNDLIKEK